MDRPSKLIIIGFTIGALGWISGRLNLIVPEIGEALLVLGWMFAIIVFLIYRRSLVAPRDSKLIGIAFKVYIIAYALAWIGLEVADDSLAMMEMAKYIYYVAIFFTALATAIIFVANDSLIMKKMANYIFYVALFILAVGVLILILV